MGAVGVLLVALIGLVLNLAPPVVGQADVSPDVIAGLIPATVKIWILDRRGRLYGGCSGSIVAAHGIILTASHCVRSWQDDPSRDVPEMGLKRGQRYRAGDLLNPDGLVLVGLTLPGRDIPVPLYYARRLDDVAGLSVLDMAILQIVAIYDQGHTPVSGHLHLPIVRIGDASRIRIGDRVAILGFPGIGGSTITVVKGNVVGFYPDYLGRPKHFLKQDTMASHGHSGGPIVNAAGEEIAVVSSGETDTGAQTGYDPLTTFIPQAWGAYLQGAPAGATLPQSAHQAVLTGFVRDAATGKGIQDASLIVWRLGVDPRLASEHDVLTDGTTDASGQYRTDVTLPKGATYPAAVIAAGYQTVLSQITIAPGDPDVIQMKDVDLQKL